MKDTEITTMVCFHDLLGFGNMLSVSGGTLDSAVGGLALKRVNFLRETVSEVSEQFPEGTNLFQMNDSAIASCDIDLAIGSLLVDSEHLGSIMPTREVALKILKFVSASSKLHYLTITKEQCERIGPAGRTFLVLGKRWPVISPKDKVTDVPELQANLAFSEAYIADSLGSKAGFMANASNRVYINDLMWFILKLIGKPISGLSSLLGDLPEYLTNMFPMSLQASEAERVEVTIFHRKRVFHSITSQLAMGITKSLNSK